MARFDVYANSGKHTATTPCLLETPKMSAIPRSALKSPVISMAHEQDQISAALDFLFQGY